MVRYRSLATVTGTNNTRILIIKSTRSTSSTRAKPKQPVNWKSSSTRTSGGITKFIILVTRVCRMTKLKSQKRKRKKFLQARIVYRTFVIEVIETLINH